MTYPRSHLVDPAGGTYHVCSRCVRRAFLCGFDQQTGLNFDHRRQWLEDRIHQLVDIFAIDLFGYAVMSNHYHIVLAVVPDRVSQWTDDEIADKWLALFPKKPNHPDATNIRKAQRNALLADDARLAVLRERLSSLSWFMRCINEPLARLANKEDHCKGRFWEGRFKSQQILDDTALLACMVYVDLNPVRAGIANELKDCQYTSIARRLSTQDDDQSIRALNHPFRDIAGNYTLKDYRILASWTALAQQSQKPINQQAQQSLAKANAPNAQLWLDHYQPRPGHWQRALGSFQALKDHAQDLGQRWIRTRSLHLS